MTNAEKLAKDTDTLAKWIVNSTGMCNEVDDCRFCKYHGLCTDIDRMKEWLESEADEDVKQSEHEILECSVPECCGNCCHKTMYDGEVDTCHCDRDWSRHRPLEKCKHYLPILKSEKEEHGNGN